MSGSDADTLLPLPSDTSNDDTLIPLPSSYLSVPKLTLEGVTIRKKSTVRQTLDANYRENEKGERRLNNYLFKGVIGSGAFGTVYGAVDETTSEVYAIKEFSKSKLRKTQMSKFGFKSSFRGRGRGRVQPMVQKEDPLDLVRGEIAVLKKLKHVNVVKLFEVLDDPNQDSLFMVFELCDNGNLMDVSLTKTETPFDEDAARYYFRQMILGIEYLHEHDIVHRDIKPDNLLIDEKNVLKIVDFGVSEMFTKGSDTSTKSAGSPAFFAPEMCRAHHGPLSLKPIDIWAMGVTLYCMVTGHLPFASPSIVDLYENIREKHPEIPEDLSDDLKDLLSKILEKDPEKRITMEYLRIHPWVENGVKLISKEENCIGRVDPTKITKEEYEGAIKSVNLKVAGLVMMAATKFKKSSSIHSDSESPLLSRTQSFESPIPTSSPQSLNITRSSSYDQRNILDPLLSPNFSRASPVLPFVPPARTVSLEPPTPQDLVHLEELSHRIPKRIPPRVDSLDDVLVPPRVESWEDGRSLREKRDKGGKSKEKERKLTKEETMEILESVGVKI